MLYEMFVATIILGWAGTCIALITMGMYYSDTEREMPIRVFIILALIQMVLVLVIASWASPEPYI